MREGDSDVQNEEVSYYRSGRCVLGWLVGAAKGLPTCTPVRPVTYHPSKCRVVFPVPSGGACVRTAHCALRVRAIRYSDTELHGVGVEVKVHVLGAALVGQRRVQKREFLGAEGEGVR